MIDRVVIKGYRMLSRVDVKLGPLTVLIGENNSGKSSLLRAIASFASPEGWAPFIAWRGVAEIVTTLFASIDGQPLRGTQRCTSASGFAEEEQASVIRGWLAQASPIQLPREGASMTGDALADAQGPPLLDTRGGLLPGLLDHLQRRQRDQFDQLLKAAREHIPGLQDITLVADQPARRTVHLTVEGGHDLDGNLASSGVRALLYFLALAYHPKPPPILLVEEPETGLHPQRLGDVVKLLRSITRGEHAGRSAQVILTTHSPYLLDHINPTEDQVLVFRRGPEGEALVEPVDAERLKAFMGEFMLGEVWFNQGEAGLVSRPGNQ